MIVDKIIPIDQLDQNLTHGMKIMIDQQTQGEVALKTAHEILRGYPGNRQLKIEIILDNGMRVEMDSNKRIDINDQLVRRLTELLGKSSIEMLIDRKSLSAKSEPRKWGKKS